MRRRRICYASNALGRFWWWTGRRGRSRGGGCCDRPDLYFYGPLPSLATLDAAGLHARMRCVSTTTFTEHHLAADSHHILRQHCGHNPLECDCHKAPKECPRGAVRVEDAFAIIPRPLGSAYFATHAKAGHVGLSKTTNRCPTWEVCKAAGSAAARKAKGCHAVRVPIDGGLARHWEGEVVPTALYFCHCKDKREEVGSGRTVGAVVSRRSRMVKWRQCVVSVRWALTGAQRGAPKLRVNSPLRRAVPLQCLCVHRLQPRLLLLTT